MYPIERKRLKTNISRGIQVFVEDLDLLLSHTWAISEGYARGHKDNITRAKVFLHRLILGRMMGRDLLRHECVDHINGDRLDNRRSNLRLATYAQNQANRKRRPPNSTGYKGVTKRITKKKGVVWYASIRAQGLVYRLGTFNTPKAAHEAYKAAAIKYHGEFARFE